MSINYYQKIRQQCNCFLVCFFEKDYRFRTCNPIIVACVYSTRHLKHSCWCRLFLLYLKNIICRAQKRRFYAFIPTFLQAYLSWFCVCPPLYTCFRTMPFTGTTQILQFVMLFSESCNGVFRTFQHLVFRFEICNNYYYTTAAANSDLKNSAWAQ